MDISILNNSGSEGEVSLKVSLDLEDIEQLRGQAARAREIERDLPPAARTVFADASDDVYFGDFVRTRAVNDALEMRSIVPAATPKEDSSGYVDGKPYTCTVRVLPRPEIGITSLEPVDLATNRIAKPGFSAKAGREGSDGVEFIDDEKTLRMTLTKRLDSEIPEPVMRALGEEYQKNFEVKLAENNIDPESYWISHGLDEEQYKLMMARNALSEAHWNYALDAVFVGKGFEISADDLIATYELQFPGYGNQLFELHDLRNDLHRAVEKYRRGKALMWLKDNAIR